VREHKRYAFFLTRWQAGRKIQRIYRAYQRMLWG
jgi:hypothetical protein